MSSTYLSGNTIQQKYISLEIPLLFYSPTPSTSDQLQPTPTEKTDSTWSALYGYGVPNGYLLALSLQA